MTPADLNVAAWIRWVDAYCPLRGLSTGPRDLVHLCQVPDRTIAALAAEGWTKRTLASRRSSGAVRTHAAELVLEQVERYRTELEAERRASHPHA